MQTILLNVNPIFYTSELRFMTYHNRYAMSSLAYHLTWCFSTSCLKIHFVYLFIVAPKVILIITTELFNPSYCLIMFISKCSHETSDIHIVHIEPINLSKFTIHKTILIVWQLVSSNIVYWKSYLTIIN